MGVSPMLESFTFAATGFFPALLSFSSLNQSRCTSHKCRQAWDSPCPFHPSDDGSCCSMLSRSLPPGELTQFLVELGIGREHCRLHTSPPRYPKDSLKKGSRQTCLQAPCGILRRWKTTINKTDLVLSF
ncbi:uncharacterized protein G2W53_009599 [Senna tora]|uniref:Uncharacterized protein n=1 Tax=Senna tora TaxID=362788 RepID=A0A834WXS9_9FABA|nr:uncharacterized protein G2W53_009599 [Senna tora]